MAVTAGPVGPAVAAIAGPARLAVEVVEAAVVIQRRPALQVAVRGTNIDSFRETHPGLRTTRDELSTADFQTEHGQVFIPP